MSCVAGVLGFVSIAKAETATFTFAPVGGSFSAFIPPDSPLVGKEIVTARIYLDVESFPGSDAANFYTDILFPLVPFPGNVNWLVLLGTDLGWSGSGTFHYFEETTRFNGIFGAYRYGGETPGDGFQGQVLDTSRIEFDYISAGLTLESSASRKTGRAGSFDISLPGVDDRSDRTPDAIVFTFNNNVTGADSATTSCGTVGSVSIDPDDSHKLLVTFNGATCNAQNVTVTATNVHDDQGNTLASAETTVGMLIGDVNGDGRVDSGDIDSIQGHRGERTNAGHFRNDINVDGHINNRDVHEARSHMGQSLP
jgi:hypothetical protein